MLLGLIRQRLVHFDIGWLARDSQRWYKKNSSVADDLFDAHLQGLKGKGVT